MNKYVDKIMELAYKSLKSGDIPVGAIVVRDEIIIGSGYNTREKYQSIIGHAEINAILNASRFINNWNLSGCSIYVTLRPCKMCEEIIKQSRISNVYYLVEKPNSKKEFYKTNFTKITDEMNENIYKKELNNFFLNLREK